MTDVEYVAGHVMVAFRDAVKETGLTRDQQTDAIAYLVKAWIEHPDILLQESEAPRG